MHPLQARLGRLALATLAASCASAPPAPNPPAPGFDAAGSDPRAIAIADEVMAALGGRAAWDSTRVLTWTFFGRRRLWWDRSRGDVRVESPEEDLVVTVNVHTREGRTWKSGLEFTREGERAPLLDAAWRQWINDSYWLVMPYKLKDSGVTLTDLGGRDFEGQPVDVLGLTFESVGVTPSNRYQVFVARAPRRVVGWSYFADAADGEPRLTTPWTGWERHGAILLGGGRGEREITDIAVLERPPAGMMDSPTPL